MNYSIPTFPASLPVGGFGFGGGPAVANYDCGAKDAVYYSGLSDHQNDLIVGLHNADQFRGLTGDTLRGQTDLMFATLDSKANASLLAKDNDIKSLEIENRRIHEMKILADGISSDGEKTRELLRQQEADRKQAEVSDLKHELALLKLRIDLGLPAPTP